MQTVVGCCQEEINWVRYGAVLKKKEKKGRKEENPHSKKEEKKKSWGIQWDYPLEDWISLANRRKKC